MEWTNPDILDNYVSMLVRIVSLISTLIFLHQERVLRTFQIIINNNNNNNDNNNSNIINNLLIVIIMTVINNYYYNKI